MSLTLPDKLYFKIGEVSEIVGVKPHVLRYWESEFAGLSPKKTRGSHRMYSRKDVELAVRIRCLLHDEGYTIAGAKKKLRSQGAHRKDREPDPRAVRESEFRAELLGLRASLAQLLDDLEVINGDQELADGSATVREVVPAEVSAEVQRRRR